MKKMKEYESDLEECKGKLELLLKEYNSRLEYDIDIGRVLLIDNDTNKFEMVD